MIQHGVLQVYVDSGIECLRITDKEAPILTLKTKHPTGRKGKVRRHRKLREEKEDPTRRKDRQREAIGGKQYYTDYFMYCVTYPCISLIINVGRKIKGLEKFRNSDEHLFACLSV